MDGQMDKVSLSFDRVCAAARTVLVLAKHVVEGDMGGMGDTGDMDDMGEKGDMGDVGDMGDMGDMIELISAATSAYLCYLPDYHNSFSPLS